MNIFGRMKARKDTTRIIRERFNIGAIRSNEVYRIMNKQGLDINDAWREYTTKDKDIDE